MAMVTVVSTPDSTVLKSLPSLSGSAMGLGQRWQLYVTRRTIVLDEDTAERIGLRPGDRLVVREENGHIVLERAGDVKSVFRSYWARRRRKPRLGG